MRPGAGSRPSKASLVIRISADTLILAPALVAEPEQLDRICEIVAQVLTSL